jgi:hypothetical protein
MADLTPEDKALLTARDKALLAHMKTRGFPNPEGGEAHWEQTLSELTGGSCDTPFGLRVFVADLQAANDKQAFLDAAALKIIQGLTDPGPQREQYARDAYDMAEILWQERRRRRHWTEVV